MLIENVGLSATHQNLDRQLGALRAAEREVAVVEDASGIERARARGGRGGARDLSAIRSMISGLR